MQGKNKLIEIVLPILFVVIIISAYYLGKWKGSSSLEMGSGLPDVSVINEEKIVQPELEGVGYDLATTTITLPTDGYSTKITEIPPPRTLSQLVKNIESWAGAYPAYPYHEYYIEDVEEFGDIASRFIDKSLGISKVRKFDVDADGKDETIITLCAYATNGCPQKFIIVKDDKVIFSIDQGGRHLKLIESVNGNGFTVHWTPITGTEREMSYCCPTAHMETTFKYINGTLKPVSEKKVRNTKTE